jgi:hypothetical protein
MGVIHKLKPEIQDFILETQKNDLTLSCRKIVALVYERFNVRVSKSSINMLIKKAGLSMPVGRRCKKPRRMPSERLREVITQASASIQVETETKAPPVPIAPVEKVTEKPEAMPAPLLPSPEELPALPEEIKELPKPQEPVSREVKPLSEEPSPALPSREIPLPQEAEGLGAILLCSADYLVGGSFYLTEAIKNRLKSPPQELLAKTKALLYAPLFGLSESAAFKPESNLWNLINCKFDEQEITAFRSELEQMKLLSTEIFRTISTLFQEARGIQVNLADGKVFYLDGQFYTIWSAPQLPYDFSAPLHQLRIQLEKYFQKDEPCVLLMAPGYDYPTQEFFDFILSFDSSKNSPTRLALYGSKFEELEVVRLEESKKRFFIFGLWPWQFSRCRQLKLNVEFSSFHFAPLKKDFYLAEGKLDLSQPNINQSVTLRAVALKASPNEKIRLIICTNLTPERFSAPELLDHYLSCWPNLQEAFEDFSRKVELFTYTANIQHTFTLESLDFKREFLPPVNSLFSYHLLALDAFVRSHFLPSGYEKQDFPFTKLNFYDLRVRIQEHSHYAQAIFVVPRGYAFLKDLGYALCRLNEKEIKLYANKKLWFSLSA